MSECKRLTVNHHPIEPGLVEPITVDAWHDEAEIDAVELLDLVGLHADMQVTLHAQDESVTYEITGVSFVGDPQVRPVKFMLRRVVT